MSTTSWWWVVGFVVYDTYLSYSTYVKYVNSRIVHVWWYVIPAISTLFSIKQGSKPVQPWGCNHPPPQQASYPPPTPAVVALVPTMHLTHRPAPTPRIKKWWTWKSPLAPCPHHMRQRRSIPSTTRRMTRMMSVYIIGTTTDPVRTKKDTKTYYPNRRLWATFWWTIEIIRVIWSEGGRTGRRRIEDWEEGECWKVVGGVGIRSRRFWRGFVPGAVLSGWCFWWVAFDVCCWCMVALRDCNAVLLCYCLYVIFLCNLKSIFSESHRYTSH